MGRVSLFSSALPGWDAERVVAAAVSLGLGAIEWGVGPGQAIADPGDGARIAALCREAALAVAGLAVQDHHGVTLAAPRAAARHVALARELRRAARAPLRAALRGRAASARRSGARAPASTRSSSRPRGLRILVETSPGTLAPSPELALELVAHHPARLAGVLYDPGNMAIEGHLDAPLSLALLGRHLRHVHVKNIAWSRRDGLWRWGYADLDRGVLAWPAILHALRAARYGGWISIDHLGRRPTAALLGAECRRLLEWTADAWRS